MALTRQEQIDQEFQEESLYDNPWADRELESVSYNEVAEEDSQESEAVARMRAQLNQSGAFQRLDEMVLKHGVENGERWSFTEHEFQRQIIRDTSARLDVKKCSQVGLSSTVIQKTLAMLSVLKHSRVIYSMPTTKDAYDFSKDRFDPAIDHSPYYSGLVKTGKDSGSLKQIGTSTLYIRGTRGGSAGISVPALVVINDELDFSDQRVIAQLASRLRHNKTDEDGNKGYRFRFSTPTVEDFGIDSAFNDGTQNYYLVKCKHCNTWHQLDYFRDMHIPGFDMEIDKLSIQDFQNEKYRFNEAMLLCPGCRNEIQSSLIDPTRRTWAAKYPDRISSSYQVYPWDVPTINTPSSIVRQFQDYSQYEEEFYNFVIGVARTTADNSFLTNEKQRRATMDDCLKRFESGDSLPRGSTVMGLDTGKKCHLTVLAKADRGYKLIWAETLNNTVDDPAAPKVKERFTYFGAKRLCVDAGPDISLANDLVAWGKGKVMAVEYARRVEGLDSAKMKDEGRIVRADRNKTMSALMKDHNAGRILYAREIQNDVFEHLKTIKRVVDRNASSFDEAERFTSTGQDHYGHSLNYARIAADDELHVIEKENKVRDVPLTVGGVKVGGKASSAAKHKHQRTDLNILRNLYGNKY